MYNYKFIYLYITYKYKKLYIKIYINILKKYIFKI